MSQRSVLHIILCVFLAGVGWWLYLQLSENEINSITSMSVASYWFGLLIFLFISWIFYWILHRRSTKAWLIALFIAFVISVVSTIALLIISHEHEAKRQAEEDALNQEQDSEDLLQQDPDLEELQLENQELEELQLEDEELEELQLEDETS